MKFRIEVFYLGTILSLLLKGGRKGLSGNFLGWIVLNLFGNFTTKFAAVFSF